VNVAAGVLVGLVAALHLVFLVLEMLLWTTPTGRGVFGLDGDFARRSRAATRVSTTASSSPAGTARPP
jgi:putative membrane protein